MTSYWIDITTAVTLFPNKVTSRGAGGQNLNPSCICILGGREFVLYFGGNTLLPVIQSQRDLNFRGVIERPQIHHKQNESNGIIHINKIIICIVPCGVQTPSYLILAIAVWRKQTWQIITVMVFNESFCIYIFVQPLDNDSGLGLVTCFGQWNIVNVMQAKA